MIDLDTLIIRSDAVVSAPMGEDVAMMDMESGKYFVMAEVAANIWERLVEPVRPAVLCEVLTELYDVSPEQCRAEVLAFLETAHARGLVRIVA